MKTGFCLNYYNDSILYKYDIVSNLIQNKVEKSKNLIFEYEKDNIEIDENNISLLKINVIEELDDKEYYKVNLSKDIELYINEYNIIFLFNYKQTTEEFKNFLETIKKRIIIYC